VARSKPYGIGVESGSPTGKRYCAGREVVLTPECDMDRPVGATLAELAGAVERVEDPNPIRRKPRWVVHGLLREDGVAGPCRRKASMEEPM
jgi:hypothetical protein